MSDLHDPEREIKLDDSDALAARVFALEAEVARLEKALVDRMAENESLSANLLAAESNLRIEKRAREQDADSQRRYCQQKLAEQRIAHHEKIREIETARDVAAGKLYEQIAILQSQVAYADREIKGWEKRLEKLEPEIKALRAKAALWDRVEPVLAGGDLEGGEPYTEILERILAEHTGRTEALQKVLDLLLPYSPRDFVYDPLHPEWFVEDLLRRLIEQSGSARRWASFVEQEIIALHYRLIPNWEYVDPITTLGQIHRRFERMASFEQRTRLEQSWERENRRLDAERERLRGWEHMGG